MPAVGSTDSAAKSRRWIAERSTPITPFTPNSAFGSAVASIRDGRLTVEAAAADVVSQLTDDELLWLLDGDTPMLRGLVQAANRYNWTPFPAGHIERLGIPGLRFVDGPRGVVVGNATAFPVSISRAARWDTDLERRVGDAIGKEARAAGGNCFAGICINVAPFPGWGRSQESYAKIPFWLDGWARRSLKVSHRGR